MHNFGTVLQFELQRTLKKPTFWLSILSIPLLFGVIAAVIYFSNRSSSERENQLAQEPFSLIVQDESGIIAPPAIIELRATTTTHKSAAIEQVRSGQTDAFFYYPADISTQEVQVYSKNDGIVDNGKYTTLAKQIAQQSALANIENPSVATAIQDNLQVTQTNYSDGESVNPLGQLVAPAFFLIIFYAIIVLLGNQMLTSTTEEKENRVTEMLLTSITSRALIIGKIASLIILGFVQIAVIIIPLVLAYVLARDALGIPDLSAFLNNIQIELWPTLLGAGLLVSGFLLFTGLLVGIGAATPTAKEANSFFGFVILLMVVPFYFFSMLMTPSTSIIVTGLSYFPLTAPFTLLIRNAFGTLALHEAIIGLVIVSIAGIIAISAAIRIFRYGTLEYSSRISLKSVFGNKSKKHSS